MVLPSSMNSVSKNISLHYLDGDPVAVKDNPNPNNRIKNSGGIVLVSVKPGDVPNSVAKTNDCDRDKDCDYQDG
jgi:hypothetical protein